MSEQFVPPIFEIWKTAVEFQEFHSEMNETTEKLNRVLQTVSPESAEFLKTNSNGLCNKRNRELVLEFCKKYEARACMLGTSLRILFLKNKFSFEMAHDAAFLARCMGVSDSFRFGEIHRSGEFSHVGFIYLSS